jgi:hypothetical protein
LGEVGVYLVKLTLSAGWVQSELIWILVLTFSRLREVGAFLVSAYSSLESHSTAKIPPKLDMVSLFVE